MFNEWCSDNGLEYVEIVDPSVKAEAPAPEPSDEDENDDPFGICRYLFFTIA